MRGGKRREIEKIGLFERSLGILTGRESISIFLRSEYFQKIGVPLAATTSSIGGKMINIENRGRKRGTILEAFY